MPKAAATADEINLFLNLMLTPSRKHWSNDDRTKHTLATPVSAVRGILGEASRGLEPHIRMQTTCSYTNNIGGSGIASINSTLWYLRPHFRNLAPGTFHGPYKSAAVEGESAP